MKDKIFIACPTYGHTMMSQTATSLVALTRELSERGMFGGISCLSFPDIVDIRNVFLSIWHDAMDASHMLFVDADMQFEPDLVRDMILADKRLIGALYPVKRIPLKWVGSALVPEKEPEGNLLELEGIGCGVMLIRRDCIDNMIEKGKVEIETDLRGTAIRDLVEPTGVNRIIHGFDKVITPDGRKLSEDFSFCYRHRESGGKVWAPINHTLCHLGIHQYTARYSDMYKAKP